MNRDGRVWDSPLRRFQDPVWFRRDRRGFMAVAVIVLRMTEIAP